MSVKGDDAMWIGSMRVGVWTGDTPTGGTDSLVTAMVVREGDDVINLRLAYATENDLERGSFRDYFYLSLPQIFHGTVPLPPGIGRDPMPYPDHGIEFSNGLAGKLELRLVIHGDDLWLKDKVDLSIREVRERATSFDTLGWAEDPDWTIIGTWDRDVVLSTDSGEGVSTWRLVL